MDNWICFDKNEYIEIWDIFEAKYNFPPSFGSESYKPNIPYIKYSLVNIFNHKSSDNDWDIKVKEAFIKATNNDEFIYALDWQHESYYYNPRLPDRQGIFIIPFFPDGDFYIFTPKDFRWAFLTHPWEQYIILAGMELIDSFKDVRSSFIEIELERNF